MNAAKNGAKGWWQAIGGAVAAGLFVVPFRLLGETQEPLSATFMTLLCGFALNLPLFFGERRPNPQWSKSSLFFLSGAVFSIFGNLFAIIAVASMAPALMNVVQRFEIPALVIFGMLFFKEKYVRFTGVSLLLVFAGIFLIRHEPENPTLSGWLPPLLALLSGVCFALLQVSNKFLLKNHRPGLINSVRLGLACLILACFPGLLRETWQAGGWAWLWAFGSAFCGPFMARLLYIHALNNLQMGKIGFCQSLSPVFSVAFQWAAFGTLISFQQFVGSLLVLSAVLLIFKSREKNVR